MNQDTCLYRHKGCGQPSWIAYVINHKFYGCYYRGYVAGVLQAPHAFAPAYLLQVDCTTVKTWLVKNSAESENMNWILANTKPCPKCQRPIEKNQAGCSYLCLPPLSSRL